MRTNEAQVRAQWSLPGRMVVTACPLHPTSPPRLQGWPSVVTSHTGCLNETRHCSLPRREGKVRGGAQHRARDGLNPITRPTRLPSQLWGSSASARSRSGRFQKGYLLTLLGIFPQPGTVTGLLPGVREQQRWLDVGGEARLPFQPSISLHGGGRLGPQGLTSWQCCFHCHSHLRTHLATFPP